jgi:hypothetical protein
MKIALDLIPKETIDDYAMIECTAFGDILVQAMGINAGCSVFKRSNRRDCYLIGYVLDNGEEYMERFEYNAIKKALEGKSASVTVEVYNR